MVILKKRQRDDDDGLREALLRHGAIERRGDPCILRGAFLTEPSQIASNRLGHWWTYEIEFALAYAHRGTLLAGSVRKPPLSFVRVQKVFTCDRKKDHVIGNRRSIRRVSSLRVNGDFSPFKQHPFVQLLREVALRADENDMIDSFQQHTVDLHLDGLEIHGLSDICDDRPGEYFVFDPSAVLDVRKFVPPPQPVPPSPPPDATAEQRIEWWGECEQVCEEYKRNMSNQVTRFCLWRARLRRWFGV